MRKEIRLLLWFVFCTNILFAQPTLKSRMIFLGNVGAAGVATDSIIANASQMVVPNQTTTFFLGNNVYPDGLPLVENKRFQKRTDRLKSQFQPFRQTGSSVIYLSGNRDWDHDGPEGLDKIKKQSDFFNQFGDSLVKMLPQNGDPGPFLVSHKNGLAIIILNSEWWLYVSNQLEVEDDDSINQMKKNVLNDLNQLFFKYRNETILLLTHHPSLNYGRFGGKFGWKQHIFPLTDVRPGLYLPLPGVGSLYPLTRKFLSNAQQLQHPDYQELMDGIGDAVKGNPNFIQVSAHEPGAQLIRDTFNNLLQVVTAIGQQKPSTQKSDQTIFNDLNPSFVVADWMSDSSLVLSFYAYKENKIRRVFSYTKKHEATEAWQESLYPSLNTDSTTAQINNRYEKRSEIGRFWLGADYRPEWAATVKLPVLDIAKLQGGLKPVRAGGGNQTVSLRLKDKVGNTYQLRKVQKIPDRIIPNNLSTPLTKLIVSDYFSQMHPYSALSIPPIAEAVGVPHSHPIIGKVAPSPKLKGYQSQFAESVSLFEERNPLGKSDNFQKALKLLQKDNRNTFDAKAFLKARMFDLLIGDWDRHFDQWRFYNQNDDSLKGKNYIMVPRDRDMAFNVTQGVFVWYARHFLIKPPAFGFKKGLMGEVNTYFYNSGFMNAFPASQLSWPDWKAEVDSFVQNLSDSVLIEGIAQMPPGLDSNRNQHLVRILKARRDQLPAAMEKHYRFINKIVDVRLSDKNELVYIEDAPGTDAGTQLTVFRLSKKGNLKGQLMKKVYPKDLTKEIRLYLGKGNDSVVIDRQKSTVKLRIIADTGYKVHEVIHNNRKIKVYAFTPGVYHGQKMKVHERVKPDTAFVNFHPVNLYPSYIPFPLADISRDDGLMLGLGVQFTQQRGFHKEPYQSKHVLMALHAIGTKAFKASYSGDWVNVIGRTHFILNADVALPNSSENFFGVGNETKLLDPKHTIFYRTRYDFYRFEPGLKWIFGRSRLQTSASLTYFHMNPEANQHRFIELEPTLLNSFDSAFIDKDKVHLGLVALYEMDHRDRSVFPTKGFYFRVKGSAYKGISRFAESYAQLEPELSGYHYLNERQTIILSDRVGGVTTVGHPAFYQYAYLSGKRNLAGYFKERFAGMHSFYNNLEMRVVLTKFGNYVFRGELGMVGFWDIGRVWAPDEQSKKWHNGVGAGIYMIPASRFVIRLDVGYSPEGWFPYFSTGLRF